MKWFYYLARKENICLLCMLLYVIDSFCFYFLHCWSKITRVSLCIWIYYSAYMRIILLSYIVKFLKALLVIKYMILLKFFFSLSLHNRWTSFVAGLFSMLRHSSAGRTCICVSGFVFHSLRSWLLCCLANELLIQIVLIAFKRYCQRIKNSVIELIELKPPDLGFS